MDTTRLAELHDIVKNHPYRLKSHDDRLRKSYHDALKSLVDEFDIHLKAYRNDKFRDMRCHLMHEFHTLINDLWYSPLTGDKNAALDSCVAQTHRFLKTGEWTYIQTYYCGCNYNEKLGRWSTYVYDKELDKFVVPIEKADLYLEHYKNKIEKYEKEKKDIPNNWSKNHQSILDYYKDELIELQERKRKHLEAK